MTPERNKNVTYSTILWAAPLFPGEHVGIRTEGLKCLMISERAKERARDHLKMNCGSLERQDRIAAPIERNSLYTMLGGHPPPPGRPWKVKGAKLSICLAGPGPGLSALQAFSHLLLGKLR